MLLSQRCISICNKCPFSSHNGPNTDLSTDPGSSQRSIVHHFFKRWTTAEPRQVDLLRGDPRRMVSSPRTTFGILPF